MAETQERGGKNPLIDRLDFAVTQLNAKSLKDPSLWRIATLVDEARKYIEVTADGTSEFVTEEVPPETLHNIADRALEGEVEVVSIETREPELV